MHSNFKSDKRFSPHRNHGLTFSVVLIIVGMLFLGVNTGMLPILYKPLFSSWPIWSIFVGIYLLLNRNLFSASVLLTLGTFYIIPQIGEINPALNIPPDFAHVYWPVLLILAGIYFAIGKLFFKSYFKHGHFAKVCNTDTYTSKFETEDGFIQISSSFDSRKNIVLDPIFKGGRIDCSFGEVILDLRKTSLPEGKTNLGINVNFGSVIVVVPDSWNVKLEGESMFGSFTDSRFSPSFQQEENRVLLIDGKCSFGECKLRD